MTDYVVDLDLTRENLLLCADPRRVHRLVTTHLPDLKGRSTAIRADTATLFRIDLPNDPLGVSGCIRLRLRGKTLDRSVGTAIPVPELTDGIKIVAVLAAEKRNTDDRGIRTRAVLDEEAPAWAEALLTRHGLAPRDLAVSPRRRYGAAPGVRFSIRDISATVTLSDLDLARTALVRGVGRGRAYGLGLIVPLAAPVTT